MLTVVAAVMERGEEVLICQRRADGAHGLKWEFPGGKVEAAETPERALARELEEELGVEAEIGEELARYEFSYPGKSPILLIFCAVNQWRGELCNRVFEQIAWERRDQLASRDFLEGDAPFLEWLSAPRG